MLFLLSLCLILFGVYVLAGNAVGADPFFFLKPKITLTDKWGQEYKTRRHPGNCTYVYGATQTGFVTLNEDGTTGGESTYIKKWRTGH